MTHRQQTSILFVAAIVWFGFFIASAILWSAHIIVALASVTIGLLFWLAWEICGWLVTGWRKP